MALTFIFLYHLCMTLVIKGILYWCLLTNAMIKHLDNKGTCTYSPDYVEIYEQESPTSSISKGATKKQFGVFPCCLSLGMPRHWYQKNNLKDCFLQSMDGHLDIGLSKGNRLCAMTLYVSTGHIKLTSRHCIQIRIGFLSTSKLRMIMCWLSSLDRRSLNIYWLCCIDTALGKAEFLLSFEYDSNFHFSLKTLFSKVK